MKAKLLIVLFCSVLFATCKKQWRSTLVEGYAREYYSKQPIIGAKIELHGPEGSSRDFGLLQTAITDNEGHFVFSKFNALKDQNDNGRYIEIASPENYTTYNTDGSCWYKAGKKNVLEPTIIKPCRVKFIYNNLSPFDSNDKLCMGIDYTNEKILFTYSGIFYPPCIIGQNNFSDAGVEVSAGIDLIFYYTVTKNNISTNFSSTLHVENDTTLTFNY